VGNARFVKRLDLSNDGAVAFEFVGAANGIGFGDGSGDGEEHSWVVYTEGDECELKMPFAYSCAVDALGEIVDVRDDGVGKLSGRIVFLK